MNWLRIILDGVMMSVYFNLATALWWLIDPVAFYDDFPKEVQAASTVKPKGGKGPKVLFTCIVILPVVAFSILSAWDAGITGFWHLFWTAYVEWIFVDFGDFLGLDLLFREKMGERLELPGTHGMDAYKREVWMKKLGMPEHLLLWPLVVCPFFAVVSAGLGLLISSLVH